MVVLNMSIGKRISDLRKQHNLTQEELAKRVGISRAALSHYEKDRREPDSETIKKFATYFNVTTDSLYGMFNPQESTQKVGHTSRLSDKDERDIAKRMEEIKKDLSSEDGLMFDGEPMSEEAVESFLEAMEYAVRQTQRINKKYIPKKYRDKEKD
jgi:transcriptional regulator with XRE-family HTH domain